ncbi:hypothetical protein [Phocaeicola sp.]
MKTRLILSVGALLAGMAASAQNQYDAERLIGSDLNGTARFVGMGGAMGALGGDISVMSTNPAGIGIFRSNDVSMTFGFNNTATESSFNGTSMKDNRTRASFDQIGFVYSNKIGNNTSLRYVNFGFNYHKSKNFNRVFSAGGALNDLSQSWQMASIMSSEGMNSQEKAYDVMDAKNPYVDNQFNNYSILPIMGLRTGVIDWYKDGQLDGLYGWDGYNNNFYSKETGGISQYDFNVAFNIEDRVYLGATLGVYDVDYNLYSTYTENIQPDASGNEMGGYTLDNYYHLEGTGIDLKLGVIVRPIESSPFRIGFSVHTPTWYNLRESYDAVLSSDIFAFDTSYKEILSDYMVSPNYDYLTYDYNLTTPWRFNVNMGTTLGGIMALGAEYEYEDYSSAKYEDVDGYELAGANTGIKEYLKGVHTLRLGMETRIAPEFSVRAGYNFSSAAFAKDAYNSLPAYSTRTDFDNKKEKHTVTLGVGYRGSVVYADLAYKYDMYKSEFYAFDDIDLPATKVDNSRHQLLLTVGARF